jgi:pyruvate,water dikinase
MNLRWLNEIRLNDYAWAGDKAARLGELIGAELDVPRGFCIGADAYRAVIADPLNEKIIARLAATEIDDPVDLEIATEEIRAWIESAPMPDAFAREIRDAVGQIGNLPYAIRASRIVEDVPNPAASGLEQAFLGIVGAENALAHVRKIWATPWNSRAIYFRQRKKIETARVTMAVVAQAMVNADAGGVMFTGVADEMYIHAGWGSGAAISAGRWKPDRFVVAKNNRAIVQRDRATKAVMEFVAPEGGIQARAVPDDQQLAPALNDDHIIALAALGAKIETHFGAPQDIEWARVGDDFFILQSHPTNK